MELDGKIKIVGRSHISEYVLHKYTEKIEVLSFFSYMSDAVKYICKLEKRWSEIVKLEKRYGKETPEPVFTKSVEETKTDMKNEINGFFKEGGDG